IMGYEGLEVVNPKGGTKDAVEEAEKGQWKQEVCDTCVVLIRSFSMRKELDEHDGVCNSLFIHDGTCMNMM
ncbi:hypothetical protein HN51_065710, partial [Arachis hypogaea]